MLHQPRPAREPVLASHHQLRRGQADRGGIGIDVVPQPLDRAGISGTRAFTSPGNPRPPVPATIQASAAHGGRAGRPLLRYARPRAMINRRRATPSSSPAGGDCATTEVFTSGLDLHEYGHVPRPPPRLSAASPHARRSPTRLRGRFPRTPGTPALVVARARDPPPPGDDRHQPHQHGGEQADEHGHQEDPRIAGQGDGDGETGQEPGRYQPRDPRPTGPRTRVTATATATAIARTPSRGKVRPPVGRTPSRRK